MPTTLTYWHISHDDVLTRTTAKSAFLAAHPDINLAHAAETGDDLALALAHTQKGAPGISVSREEWDSAGVFEILTVWQASMAMVSSFPHPPDRLRVIMDALAEEHGEPSVASVPTASADQTPDTWASLDDHIFKAKLNHPLPIQAAG
ncbi:hypothetical protein ABBQ38_000936 [Trebouxia sp. C0009 RCD-2024]